MPEVGTTKLYTFGHTKTKPNFNPTFSSSPYPNRSRKRNHDSSPFRRGSASLAEVRAGHKITFRPNIAIRRPAGRITGRRGHKLFHWTSRAGHLPPPIQLLLLALPVPIRELASTREEDGDYKGRPPHSGKVKVVPLICRPSSGFSEEEAPAE
ncbi:unnamed protein product [Protopolystoma xenopodis]|uniref:Uncharacterized protein n=1 Tax=Protopolystoma xenopodis TaxID=117903 RepID=A0A448WIR3_9PLAT|nr:unnamed protein product [Protopolystoma xenopodis]